MSRKGSHPKEADGAIVTTLAASAAAVCVVLGFIRFGRGNLFALALPLSVWIAFKVRRMTKGAPLCLCTCTIIAACLIVSINTRVHSFASWDSIIKAQISEADALYRSGHFMESLWKLESIEIPPGLNRRLAQKYYNCGVILNRLRRTIEAKEAFSKARKCERSETDRVPADF